MIIGSKMPHYNKLRALMNMYEGKLIMYACIIRETFVFTVFRRVFHSILKLELCWHACRRRDQIIPTCRHGKNMPTTALITCTPHGITCTPRECHMPQRYHKYTKCHIMIDSIPSMRHFQHNYGYHMHPTWVSHAHQVSVTCHKGVTSTPNIISWLTLFRPCDISSIYCHFQCVQGFVEFIKKNVYVIACKYFLYSYI